MDLFDNTKVKYNNLIVDKTIFHYNTKILEFIDKPKFFNDDELLRMLQQNYFKYGIICSSLVKSDLFKERELLLYSDVNKVDEIKNTNLFIPKKFLDNINFYIDKTYNAIVTIEKNHKIFMEYDNTILVSLGYLRNKNYFEYLKNLIDCNNIRFMINRIFFEYFQDLSNYYNLLNQIKYDFFVTESNIIFLHKKYYKIINMLDVIFNQKLFLLMDNNTQEFNIKNEDGTIKYNEFIKIIETCIEKI